MPRKSSSTVKVFYPRFSYAQLVGVLAQHLSRLARTFPLKRAVLFGSWVRGKATAFSDIDLLIIYEDPVREDAYRLIWNSLDLRGLELHVYTERQAEEHKAMLERMIENGVVVFPTKTS
ncbi:MAG TPA: nucleotidyltransferase domain-containing protein [Acidobacteriota bacterium]|nr:nucleotidyltransferase domain-containing protein [Acidobacteriota bacterium]